MELLIVVFVQELVDVAESILTQSHATSPKKTPSKPSIFFIAVRV